MDHQLPPDGDWRTWVILGGRGAGKTRAGAEWVRSQVEGARPLDKGRASRLALIADPWSGPVAVYGSDGGTDFVQELLLSTRNVIGQTLTPIVAKTSAVEDNGIGFDVEIGAGQLKSISKGAAEVGYNMAVLGNPDTQVWEVIQFRTAELIGPSQYRLRNIKWGLRGTDSERPNIWAEGTQFVFLGHDPKQIPLRTEQRDKLRVYRVGPADRGPSDPAFHEVEFACRAKGLRPLSPVHLKIRQTQTQITATWIRRGRVDADTWFDTDIPIGKEREEYMVTILKDGNRIYSELVHQPMATIDLEKVVSHGYPNADHTFVFDVAQVSANYGAGLSNRQPLT